MSEMTLHETNGASALAAALRGTQSEQKLALVVCESRFCTGSPLQISNELHKLRSIKSVYWVAKNKDDHKDMLPVDSGLVVEMLLASKVATLLAHERVDALLIQPQCIAGNGDAMVEEDLLTAAIIAQHFKTPTYALIDTGSIQLTASTGEELVAESDCNAVQLPASLITGFLTEKGLICRKEKSFDLPAFVKHRYGIAPFGQQFSSFVALTEATAIEYIKAHPALSDQIGSKDAKLTCREAGDGNLNYVYLVEGPKGGLVIKQALPYIRVVGEGWPLTQDRLRIEAKWLMTQYKLQPKHVPFVHCYDETMAVIVMDYMAPPCLPLRNGILNGEIYPLMSQHIAGFLAHSLFFTSALALKSNDYRSKVMEFHNPELCRATEQVIFMDAYYNAPTNAFLSPELDEVARDLREDAQSKIAIGHLRNLFLSKPQALLHADFHTGSVMVEKGNTYIFDSEFAFYGPAAFDVGKFLGNLLLAYFALDGHATAQQPRKDQQQWILHSVAEVWEGFHKEFLRLWDENQGMGDAYPEAIIRDPEGALKAIQDDYMTGLFGEVLSFAGACMIRRLITIAQIADYITIQDRSVRATCAKRALKLARCLLVDGTNTDRFPSIQSVVQLAQEIKTE